MKYRITITTVIFLFSLVLAGCQSNSLKASYNQSRPEAEAEIEINVESDGEAVGHSETDCAVLNPHPMAVSITEKFDITYDEVMTLYCDGFAFSDILLALETSELVDQSPAALLARLRARSWQEIWDEFGISPD